MERFYKVYNFTNENVDCLKYLYDFKNAKVLSIVGSGDQYFVSILNGAKQVDIFDINPTSYLYFLLKFYSIRELSYEEFYDFFVKKNFTNIFVFEKLNKVLPKKVLEYYKYIIKHKDECNKIFKKDGVNLLSRKNRKYYFEDEKPVIPYLNKVIYYRLKDLLQKQTIPNFFEKNLIDMKDKIRGNYDIILLSNIYNYLDLNIYQYRDFLEKLNIPQIQMLYDWYGIYIEDFNYIKDISRINNKSLKYSLDIVKPSAPNQYASKRNFVYSIKKQKRK